ncbi:hypothetical protein ACI65C_004746 [Semiaphis heraclei]
MDSETPEDKVDFVAKAIEFTKLLASNNLKTRSYGIKRIKELFLKHSGDTMDVLYRALKSFTLTLRTRLQEIFLEELARVCRRKVPFEVLVIILSSFIHYISEVNDFMLIKEVGHNVPKHLLSPSPDLKMLETKFQAQHKMDKPGKSYNDLELVKGGKSDDNLNEKNENQLDPGAGNVNVKIPQIKFNPKDITKVLNKYVTEVEFTKRCLLIMVSIKGKKNNDTNAKWINDDESPILVPVGFKVEVLEPPKKKHQKKFRKSKSPILMFKINTGLNKKNIKNQNSIFIEIGMPNAGHNNSWSVSPNDGASTSKTVNTSSLSDDKICLPNIVNMGRNNDWLVSDDNDSAPQQSFKSPESADSPKMGRNNNWLVSDDNDSASQKVQKRNNPDEVEKHISLTFVPDKSFKVP